MRIQREPKKDYCIPATVLTLSLFVISVGVMLMVGEFIIRNIGIVNLIYIPIRRSVWPSRA
jgi:hypothetical protein